MNESVDTGKGSRSTMGCFCQQPEADGPKDPAFLFPRGGPVEQVWNAGTTPEFPPAFPFTHYLKHKLLPSSPRPFLPPPSLSLHYSH